MAIPQAIQQQIEQAEALQAEVYPQDAAPEGQPPAEPAAPADPAAEPPSNVVELPRQAEPVQPAEPPKPEASEDAAYWKQRFSTLQGKFNAEVPLLHQQLKEQGQQLAQLLAKLDEKAASVEQPAVTDIQDAEDFGESYVQMTDRRAEAIARKIVEQEIAKLRKEFGAVQEQVGQVTEQVAMSASERFWAEVMNLVPDWQLVDSDPAWVAWLDTTPEYAEDTYRTLATKAIQRGDAQKVANLVKLFRGPQAPAPAPQPVINPELQRQVAPSTSRASAPAQPAGKIWSSAEYQAAMDVRNVQRLGPKEAARLEAEANQAVAEGRVRW